MAPTVERHGDASPGFVAVRPLRIVLFAESSLPYVSGVTVSVDALARGLGACGHDVMLVAPRPSGGAAVSEVGSPGPAPRMAWAPSYELPVIAPPGYRMPWPTPVSAAVRAARAFDPDVVHAHSPFVSGVMALLLARAARAPLIFTHHTRFDDYSHYLGPFSTVGRAATSAWLRAFWQACDAVIAPSTDLAESIRTRLGREAAPRVHVIPTGVDAAAIRALVREDLRASAGWPQDSVVLVSLGRLAPEKSPELLIDAMARAANTEPALRIVVIGGGPSLVPTMGRAAAAGLGDRILFTGSLPRLRALATLAGGDLFAFTSRSETQGIVLAEALTAGLPAVAVDGPGVRDSVRDGVDGLVVSPTPPGTLEVRVADAFAGLVRDPERRRELAHRASSDAGRFDVHRRVAEVEALYRGALGSRPRRESEP
ncbi:MAG: glycosyltransferase [Candidatus Limnocylindria bacterium]